MKQITHTDSILENLKATVEKLSNKYYCDKKSRLISQCLLCTGLGYLGFYNEIEAISNVNPTPLAFYGVAGALFACSQSKNNTISNISKGLAVTALGIGCISYLLASQSDIAANINNIRPTVAEMLPTFLKVISASLGLFIGEKILGSFNL